VIWLHGLGAEWQRLCTGDEADEASAAGIRFRVSARAMRPGHHQRRLRDGAPGNDIAYQELALKEDERGLRESQRLIEDMIARENKRGIPSSRIVLAGFFPGRGDRCKSGCGRPSGWLA